MSLSLQHGMRAWLRGDAVHVWQTAARGMATAVAVGAAVSLGWTSGVYAGPTLLNAAGVLAAAVAVIFLAPAPAPTSPRRRRLGYGAAAVVVAAALLRGWAPAGFRPASHITAAALLLLGASLLLKPRLPWIATVADLLVAAAGCGLGFDALLRAPGATIAVSWAMAFALLLLAAAWMAAWPQRRPVSFYLEAGSAASVLRRLLPLTLLYPVLLAAAAAARGRGNLFAVHVTQAMLVVSTAAFGAALLWLIAWELDRRDAMAQLASLDLRASERRYRQQFDNNPQPMWVFSIASLRFLAVNDSAVREFGYCREEFLGMTVLDIHPAEDRERLRAIVNKGQPVKGWLWRYLTKSGTVLEAEVFAQPIDWHGEAAFLSFINDVTARRSAENQLREREEQVRTLLDSTSEGIYTLDMEGRCLWCNPAAAKLLGLAEASQLLGRQVHALAHHTRADGQPYPAAECRLAEAARTGRPVSLDEELLWRADGSSFHADMRCNPLYRGGKLSGVVIAIADASERRNLRTQIQQAQKMEAVGRLAAGIAHDFNNLLTVINGYTDMLLQQGEAPLSPDRQQRALDSIRKAGERAATLTRQLLAFSRQQVIEPKSLNLNSVLEEMDGLLRRMLTEQIELHIAGDAGLGLVHADPGQLSQILMNLVANARDAMPGGGRITIETANFSLDDRYVATHAEVAPGDYVLLTVSDTGAGMDASIRSHIFEPFFTTKPLGQGSTGLGLATVFGIVKQNGGTVSAYSEPGHGTSVKVYLPRILAGADGALRRPPATTGGGGETILLVEDEDAVRELACEVLRARGYEVLTASRPSQALELLRGYTGALAMVITDLAMPEMDGSSLVRHIAAQRPGLAVLFVSGFPDRILSPNYQLAPEIAFLQKPFSPEMLAARVRAVLAGRPETAAAAS
ncbi:MAG: PAS domain S-box protein [Acidobacteria bacterium]|nr:MAG: PAS domain S-box protein [Acidobacteriota bacterium]